MSAFKFLVRRISLRSRSYPICLFEVCTALALRVFVGSLLAAVCSAMLSCFYAWINVKHRHRYIPCVCRLPQSMHYINFYYVALSLFDLIAYTCIWTRLNMYLIFVLMYWLVFRITKLMKEKASLLLS